MTIIKHIDGVPVFSTGYHEWMERNFVGFGRRVIGEPLEAHRSLVCQRRTGK